MKTMHRWPHHFLNAQHQCGEFSSPKLRLIYQQACFLRAHRFVETWQEESKGGEDLIEFSSLWHFLLRRNTKSTHHKPDEPLRTYSTQFYLQSIWRAMFANALKLPTELFFLPLHVGSCSIRSFWSQYFFFFDLRCFQKSSEWPFLSLGITVEE